MILRLPSILVLAVSLGLAVHPAAAQPSPAPATRADRRAAKVAVDRAVVAMAEERYDDAIAALTEAYRLDPQPVHLYSLGAALHVKGDTRAARQRYWDFLASGSTDRKLLRQARAFAAELDAAIAKEDAGREDEERKRRAAEAAADEERQRQLDVDAQRLQAEAARLARERERGERAPQRPTVREPRSDGAGRGKRRLGTAALVLGGAALGGAAVAGLEARSAQRELDGLGPGDEWSASRAWLHRRGDDAETRALVLSAASAALVATGAVLYYLGERDARRGEERRITVAPSATAHGAGVVLSGAF